MQLWVGLGNPGPLHVMQRHNVGFMAADVIHDRYRFDAWRVKHKALSAQGRIGGEAVLLLKPQTFMNDSGASVGDAMRFYKLGVEDVTVFHDELDLAPMKLKVRTGGGTAGHNGLRSTEAHIGNPFRRVRIGIGHPGHKDRVTGYVLGNYAKTEIEPLSDLLAAIAIEAEWLAKGDDVRFMNDVAMRLQDQN